MLDHPMLLTTAILAVFIKGKSSSCFAYFHQCSLVCIGNADTMLVLTVCARICVIDYLRLIIFLNVIAPRPVMCFFMLICQCCFAIVKVLLKKVTYLLTFSLLLSGNKRDLVKT